ncbi:MAG: CidA/LrgA family protein [Spirochaetales bacterium]
MNQKEAERGEGRESEPRREQGQAPPPSLISLPRIMRGMAVIFGFLYLGHLTGPYLPLSVPASVVGMILLAITLVSGILPLRWVEDASRLLLHHLSLFFVPAGVGLLAYGELLKSSWAPLIIAVILGTVVTFLSTAIVYTLLKKVRNRRKSFQGSV